jgi:hypothetical protein
MTKDSEKRPTTYGIKEFYKHPGAVILTAAVLILGAFIALTFLLPQGQRINSGGYQVVYMSSGQVFFGKLQNPGGDYLVLKQPYTAQNVTPVGEAAPKDKQVSTTLLKVSQQTYGPEDVMSLKSDQVLFWQNLRADSKVTKAIEAKQ